MHAIKNLGLGTTLCLISLTCLWAISTQAQTRSDQPAQVSQEQTLRQLLAEVHELRVTLERATVTTVRFQMLMERLKVQQIQVDLLNRQLGGARSQLAKLKSAKTEDDANIKGLENRLNQSPDAQ